jgi:hypothetical protein
MIHIIRYASALADRTNPHVVVIDEPGPLVGIRYAAAGGQTLGVGTSVVQRLDLETT